LGLNQIYLLHSTSYIKISHIIAFLLIETTMANSIVSQIQFKTLEVFHWKEFYWVGLLLPSSHIFAINLILVTLKFSVKPKSCYFCMTHYSFSFFYLFPCAHIIDFGLDMVSNTKGIFNDYIKQRDKYHAWSILQQN